MTQNEFDELFERMLGNLPYDESNNVFTNGDMVVCKSYEHACIVGTILNAICGACSIHISPAFAGEDDGKGYWYVENDGMYGVWEDR